MTAQSRKPWLQPAGLRNVLERLPTRNAVLPRITRKSEVKPNGSLVGFEEIAIDLFPAPFGAAIRDSVL